MSISFLYVATPLIHKRHNLIYNKKFIKYIIANDINVILTFDPESDQAKKIIPFNYYDPIFRNIIYLSPIKNDSILSILKDCEALLYLSEMESLGMPILEATINNLPIIGPKLDYMKELLGSDYRYLFESCDNSDQTINSLLEKIDIFLKDFAVNKCTVPKLQKKTVRIKDLADYMLGLI